jgi:acyl carrier protein
VGELEEQIVRIWETVLHVDEVGGDDHFLDLGGDSLDATRIASHLENLLKIEIPLQDLFATGSPAKLARYLEQKTADAKLNELARLVDEVSLMSEAEVENLLQLELDAELRGTEHDNKG